MTRNSRYGKLENGYFHEYPFIKLENGTAIYTVDPLVWFENGYKILNEGVRPEPIERYYIQESYSEVGNEVIITYSQVESQIMEGMPL